MPFSSLPVNTMAGLNEYSTEEPVREMKRVAVIHIQYKRTCKVLWRFR